jgi:hypothetical protein
MTPGEPGRPALFASGAELSVAKAPKAERLRAACLLAAVAAILPALQFLTGVLFSRLYRDQPFVLDAWHINDRVRPPTPVPAPSHTP